MPSSGRSSQLNLVLMAQVYHSSPLPVKLEITGIPATKDSVRFLKQLCNRVTYTDSHVNKRHRYGE